MVAVEVERVLLQLLQEQPVRRILDGTMDPAELASTFATKVVPSTTVGPAERPARKKKQ